MIFEIETYKGQTITYDDFYEKFVCDIVIEDKNKNTKRLSLKDVRKEIDTFIKINLEFKPFKALFLDEYDRKDFEECEVQAIRTDGSFVVLRKGYKSYSRKKEMSRAMVYDIDIVNEKKRLRKERDEASDKYTNGVKELCLKLKPIDLSRYEHVINPSELEV